MREGEEGLGSCAQGEGRKRSVNVAAVRASRCVYMSGHARARVWAIRGNALCW